MNNELLKTKIDERTGIEYHLEGDYYIPNIVAPKQEKVILHKYGRIRLKYLCKSQYKIGSSAIYLINIVEEPFVLINRSYIFHT